MSPTADSNRSSDQGGALAGWPGVAAEKRPEPARTWRIVKLGGTTVADERALRPAVQRIARMAARHRVAVVVSALAGVTDTIDRLVDLAERGLDAPDGALDRLADAHLRHLRAVAKRGVAGGAGRRLTAELRALRGVLTAIRRRNAVAVDLRVLALTVGERLAASIVDAILLATGRSVALVDASWLLVASGSATDARPDVTASKRRAAGYLARSSARIWVVPGFFAQDRRCRLRLLGRGGSDTSATLLGAALGAERVEIWTDVDGVFAHDPRAHASLVPFDRLSYAEADRLARNGARVLHPESVAPARAAGIPVLVRNAFRPEREGTWIGPSSASLRLAAAATGVDP